MRLTGDYNSGTLYSVGDVVLYTDGVVYHLQRPCLAGTPPVNTLYWGQVSQPLADAVKLIMDALEIESEHNLELANNLTTETTGKALDATQGKALKDSLDTLGTTVSGLVIPDNIDADGILLNSSTASSTKQFLITVDDDGDLTATEVTAEEETTEEAGT